MATGIQAYYQQERYTWQETLHRKQTIMETFLMPQGRIPWLSTEIVRRRFIFKIIMRVALPTSLLKIRKLNLHPGSAVFP